MLLTAKALVIKRDKERSGLRHEPFLSWWYPLTINLEKRNGPEFILSWSKSGSNSNRIRRTGTWNNTAIILLLQYLGEEKFPIINIFLGGNGLWRSSNAIHLHLVANLIISMPTELCNNKVLNLFYKKIGSSFYAIQFEITSESILCTSLFWLQLSKTTKWSIRPEIELE